MVKTVKDINDLVNGRLVGNDDLEIDGVASLKDAESSSLSFLGNKKYIDQVVTSNAGCVLLPEEFSGELKDGVSYIYTSDPSVAFSKVIELFAPPAIEYPAGVASTAVVDNSVKVPASAHIGHCAVIEEGVVLGENTVIGAGCYVGKDARIGADCLLYPNVTIRERNLVGDRVIIHSGTVVGSDGFGFTPGANGHEKIPQVGIVQIDNDVELGANVAIDRARFGKTWIKEGAKIDNLVHIAHNVVIGKFCFIVAQVGVAGSTVLGDRVIAAGQAGFSGHLEVGEGTVVMGQAGVTKDLGAGEVVFGTPAIPRREFARNSAVVKKVAKLEQQLKELKKLVEEK